MQFTVTCTALVLCNSIYLSYPCVHNFSLLQDQYMFIHDALCDHITCGDTSVLAHELKATIATLGIVGKDTKKTGFQEQFDVRNVDQQLLSFE